MGAELIRASLAANPGQPLACCNLGAALLQLQRPQEALASFEEALKLDPQTLLALYNRANVLQTLERHDEALASYDRALSLHPQFFEASNNRGNSLLELQQPLDALASFERALQLRPDDIQALNNRGNACQALKRYDEALASYERALSLRPEVNTLNNCGNALRALKRYDAALAAYQRVLSLQPDHAEALNGRGIVLQALGQPEQALASYDRALQLRPAYSDALNNRGTALRDLRRYRDAASCFRKLLEVAPNYNYAPGALLHAQLHCCDWDGYSQQAERVIVSSTAGKRADLPFSFLSACDSPAAQLQCARGFVADRCPPVATPIWRGERYAHNRIRVAYVSADFHAHATSYLMAGLFERHDRERFEITAISFGPEDGSAMRARLRRAFDRFVDVRSMSDAAVAQLLRDSEIDIAVDLKGFTIDSRLEIFAHRPTPIQVNYLGYPGTVGSPYIDYIVADQEVIPPADQGHYAEQVAYLPDCYQVNDSARAIAARTPGRAEVGLPPAGFVFCCFNNNYKITPLVFDIWMRLLRQVPGSVLWLFEANEVAAGNLRREAERRGVQLERLVFAPRLPLEEHLARQRLADLFLDTLPVNAHTTASDALWAGVPVLTCQGQAFAARVAGSLLKAVDLPQLVTKSLEEYEQRALELATNPTLLGDIRAQLAASRSHTPLFDTARCCRHLESAYLTMWQRYQRGESPAGFTVAQLPKRA
jgi:predicted O-linked N-acetylglucosamine transferase (SPINDLY family)